MQNIRPDAVFQHYKGKYYRVINLVTHTETGEKMVVYQTLYPDFQQWCRPLEMFLETVNDQPRFRYVGQL